MPDGQVQWIDTDKGVAQIARRGREYQAPLTEVEAAARVPGVRVHFDVVRDDGVAGAVNVTLRRGSRSNPKHRRFGDLTGARRAGSKARSVAAERLGVDVATQPVKVVQAWLETIAAGDMGDALALYSPDAVIHLPGGDAAGRERVRAYLADDAPRGFSADVATVVGLDEQVRVDWPDGVVFGVGAPTEEAVSSYFSVDHGHIVEQWDRVEPSELEADAGSSFVYVYEGPISDAGKEYIRDRFEHLLSAMTGPVLFGRAKFSVLERGRHRERPVSASATIDHDGRVVRAHIGAPTVTEAADELVDRIRRQLKEVTDRLHSWPTGQHADPATWQHGKITEVRPGYFDRPVDEREVVRHKSFAPDESTVEEALWDMTAFDFDFFLFTELTTGHDCLLTRGEDAAVLYMLEDDLGDEKRVDIGMGDVSVAPAGAPTLTFSQAVQRLDAGAEPHVFFRNAGTRRGNVVYRRYDGHYGVITPSNGS